MASGPVVAMVWQGLDAVKTGRVMLGATNPLASAPGQFCFILSYLIRFASYRSTFLYSFASLFPLWTLSLMEHCLALPFSLLYLPYCYSLPSYTL